MNPFELVWKRNPRAWGTKRIALRPKDGTDPLGRDRMYLHGGEVLGSAGCIDLATNMDDFVDNYYKKRVVKPYIRVKYDKESW